MMGAWVKQRWRKHLRTYQVRSCRASYRGGRVWSRTADSFLAASHALAKSLPLTLSALQSGTISWQHAVVMEDETATLDSAGAAALERHFLDPDAPKPATAAPVGDLPAHQASAAWNRLTAAARGLQGPAEARTLTQLRADLCGDWLLGGMSTTTGGVGPIPPSMARKLTADGAGSFYRVLVDPRDGAPLEIGRTSYRLTKAMRTPGQRSRPHPCLGQRWHHRVSNLGQPCPKHHRLRHASRWKPTPPTKNEPPGWTSPSGRHSRGRAPGLGTTPLASPIKASHQRLGAGDWQRAGGSWTYTAAGSSSPAVSTSAISAGRGTKRTNMAL